MNRSQKSPKSGLSIAFKLSFVAASTLTYNCTCKKKIGFAINETCKDLLNARFFSTKNLMGHANLG
jgi:hypothetical protein